MPGLAQGVGSRLDLNVNENHRARTTGRRALVTGGSRGIGRAIAEALVEAGHDVTITGRSPDVHAVADSLGARGLVLDLTDPAGIEDLTSSFPDGVDAIVNNAGGFAGTAPGRDAPLAEVAEHWHRTLQVNLVGAALVVRALEDRLPAGGAVVSIGSIGAEYAANPYSVAKAALAAWNVGLAERLGPRGTTANVVAPGYVEGTDLFGGPLPQTRRDALVGRTLLGRVCQPSDVAALVAFLVSPAARHITGQVVHVNAGAHTTR